MNAPRTERNPKTGRIQRVTPLTVSRLPASFATVVETPLTPEQREARLMQGRRRDARRRGYRGPLTRGEASMQALARYQG